LFTAFDCPVFGDLYDCVRHVAGGSLTAANCIISDTADIAINWCGGWHHCKRYDDTSLSSATTDAWRKILSLHSGSPHLRFCHGSLCLSNTHLYICWTSTAPRVDWKWQTVKISENEIDGPTCRTWNCRTKNTVL